MAIYIGIVGLGKIARDQHVPALLESDAFTLAATADPGARLPGVPHYPDLAAMLAGEPGLDAVALCTPPVGRGALAAAALAAGKHVLMEKPPGATLSEVLPLLDAARAAGRTLFAAWHSRFAPGVEPARALLAGQAVRSVLIEWREDVRVWHPGQAWVWQPGGLGVFDPGINALSILTRILPGPVSLTRSDLLFPANRDAPIAASLAFQGADGMEVRAEFDWRQTGPQTWDIRVETDAGGLVLSEGGAQLVRDGQMLVDGPAAEYAGVYRHFAGLIARGEGDVDLQPLTHVADAFMLGRRRVVEAFLDT